MQIPAYGDSQLSATVKNLLQKASGQHRLRITVLWQHDGNENLSQGIIGHPRVEIIDVPFEKSRGHSWARHILQQKWKGEEFKLLIDSHCRFIQNWDDILVKMYLSLQNERNRKPMITSYLPPFFVSETPGGAAVIRLRFIPSKKNDSKASSFGSPVFPYHVRIG